jgi:hypothetical protein
MCRQFDAPYTANIVQNAAHILQITLCELWSRPYTRYLQLRIFRLQYSAVGICAAIGDISTIQYASYCKLDEKYKRTSPVYAVWTVDPDMYNVFTAPHIQAPIFYWTYLRCNSRYHDNSVCVILQTWCQIQRTSPSLRCVNCGLGYLQSIFCSAYLGLNIQLNVPALLLETSRQVHARYSANLVPYVAHTLPFTQYVLWTRPYTMQLQRRIFRLQYSTESTWGAIGHMPTSVCAL